MNYQLISDRFIMRNVNIRKTAFLVLIAFVIVQFYGCGVDTRVDYRESKDGTVHFLKLTKNKTGLDAALSHISNNSLYILWVGRTQLYINPWVNGWFFPICGYVYFDNQTRKIIVHIMDLEYPYFSAPIIPSGLSEDPFNGVYVLPSPTILDPSDPNDAPWLEKSKNLPMD